MFKNVILEKLSFKEQVQLFNDAKIVIGQHGAGLVNSFWCQKNTVLIETDPRHTLTFKHIADILLLDYYFPQAYVV